MLSTTHPNANADPWRDEGREPLRGNASLYFRGYPHSIHAGFTPIRFQDPRAPEKWFIGPATPDAALDYARRMLAQITPDEGNVEHLLAVAAEVSRFRLPTQPIPILVSAIPQHHYAAWAEITLSAVVSTAFEALESKDRERLARLHATFVKNMPAENTAGAPWTLTRPAHEIEEERQAGQRAMKAVQDARRAKKS